jgi:hypothetical protein
VISEEVFFLGKQEQKFIRKERFHEGIKGCP